MKEKQLIIFLLLCIFSLNSMAQVLDSNKIQRSSLYLELGGNAVLYSFNFDGIVAHFDNKKIALGMGASIVPVLSTVIFIASPNANLLIGNTHHLELGTGITVYPRSSIVYTGSGYIIPFRLGYRFQQDDGGFLLRIGFTPFYLPAYGGSFHYSGGLSLGFTIKADVYEHKRYEWESF